MVLEPRLTDEDYRAWAQWQATAAIHSRSLPFLRRVESSKRYVGDALAQQPDTCVMWSGGKDSTVMTHLIGVTMGAKHLTVYSEKDDLDYPGEEQYVTDLAAQWGLNLKILRPTVSPTEWLNAHRHELHVGGDIHSRAASLSKAVFYGLVKSASSNHGGIFLGLRQDESRARRMNRATRGPVYTKNDGQTVCTPIVDWSGLDVMAYAVRHDVPLLSVYQCIAFMHAREPWRVRKSWWVPEASSQRHGGVAWLRHYFPTLYRKLAEWVPRAQSIS